MILSVLLMSMAWSTDMSKAKDEARKENKLILLSFSGSDWCGPCIRMRSEIFESEVFQKMADTQLILVNADFPRMKKNQLTLQQQELNNKMADHYNSKGRFPFTLLLDENGKVLKQWDGLPNLTAAAFTVEVRNGIYGDK